MSNLAKKTVTMAPQLVQKDVPHDPSDSEPEDAEENGVVLVETSSDDEDEDDDELDSHNAQTINGYLPLGQDATDQPVDDFSHQPFIENDETESSTATSENSATTATEEQREENYLPMEQDQVDLIRELMSNISLPSAAIPDWAKNVPEDKWKAVLVSNIANRNEPTECSHDTNR